MLSRFKCMSEQGKRRKQTSHIYSSDYSGVLKD